MSFDVLAPYYRWMERILAGAKLQRCRTAFMEHLPPAGKILLLGEGHGRFLEVLGQANWTGQVTYVDSSQEMLKQARRRSRISCPKINIEWLNANALSWTPAPRAYDLIVTHFFLDCFAADQLRELIPRLCSALKPGGRWMLADFCLPSQGMRRLRAKAILWLMYRFFRLVTRLPARQLSSPDAFLSGNGLHLRQRLFFEWGLLHADLWLLGEPSMNLFKSGEELLPLGTARLPASTESQNPARFSGTEAHAS